MPKQERRNAAPHVAGAVQPKVSGRGPKEIAPHVQAALSRRDAPHRADSGAWARQQPIQEKPSGGGTIQPSHRAARMCCRANFTIRTASGGRRSISSSAHCGRQYTGQHAGTAEQRASEREAKAAARADTPVLADGERVLWWDYTCFRRSG